MKPGALILTLEMMRRAEEADSGRKVPKKELIDAHDISKNRISDAECVPDYSIDSDLVQDVLSGAKGLKKTLQFLKGFSFPGRLHPDHRGKDLGRDPLAEAMRGRSGRRRVTAAQHEGVESGLGDDGHILSATDAVR
jgi:hypothetical protein